MGSNSTVKNWYMIVWCTQNVRRRQQFHDAQPCHKQLATSTDIQSCVVSLAARNLYLSKFTESAARPKALKTTTKGCRL